MPSLRTTFSNVRTRRPPLRALVMPIAVVVVVAIGSAVRLGHRGAGDHGGLAAAASFVDSLVGRASQARVARDVALGDAVALGYLERLRLGFSSPFRLAEYALRDPRLDSTSRRQVAWALVGRALRGDGYAIDAGVLADVGVSGPHDPPTAAAWRSARHLRLIEAAVAGARDPRAGELAVRLAYALASAERTVDHNAMPRVAQVAALVRDRHAAMYDARQLLSAARGASVDPLELLATWRRERRFVVERPAAEQIGDRLEAEAMVRAPALLDSIRAIAQAAGDSADVRSLERRDPTPPSASLLTAAAADRLAAGVARYAPPQAAIITAVRHYGPALLAAPGTASDAAARRAFLDRAVNEESFAAELARLRAHEPDAPGTARAAVAAAAALRAYAQEGPWFPGDPAPSIDDLRREFGVASVRFDAGVPAPWRPYYRRVLAEGLRDLRRVLPAIALEGARVRFRSGALAGGRLAMHDPGSRTIHLPIATSAGTLAHEVAHDLDWQMGRRRYGRRGSYGTDVVVREQRDPLAASLRGLTSARLIAPVGANRPRPPDDVRPAEVFARTLDWFVSVALAREGRMNGYLSAVQDEVLTGHVAVLPRDVGGRSAQALADVLEETTLVGAPLREWLLAQWGPARARRPYTLVHEVIAAPVTRRTAAAPRVGGSLGAPLCAAALDGPAHLRVRLARLAAEARARGALRGRAHRYPEGPRPAWAESLLGNGPWSPQLGEQAVRVLADVILSRLEESGALGAALAWREGSGRVPAAKPRAVEANGPVSSRTSGASGGIYCP
jgi:hypothetical protein